MDYQTSLMIEKKRKITKIWAISATCIYSLLFPYFVLYALLSGIVFEDSSIPFSIGVGIVFVSSWMVIAIPLGIVFIWRRYLKGKYKQTKLFCTLPLIVFIASFLILILLCFLAPRL